MLLSRSVLLRVADCLLATAEFLAPLLSTILQHSILEQFVGYPEGFVAVVGRRTSTVQPTGTEAEDRRFLRGLRS